MILWFICVVVNSLSQVIFAFLLFLGMIMYANELQQKKIKITRDNKDHIKNSAFPQFTSS